MASALTRRTAVTIAKKLAAQARNASTLKVGTYHTQVEVLREGLWPSLKAFSE